MSVIVAVLASLALLAGTAFVVIGGVGLLRLPEFFTRLHAASVTDTAGAGLVVLGLAVLAGLGLTTVKLALVLAFMLFTGPVATHVLAKAALHGGIEPRARDAGGRDAPARDAEEAPASRS